jgi:hypothetical protein
LLFGERTVSECTKHVRTPTTEKNANGKCQPFKSLMRPGRPTPVFSELIQDSAWICVVDAVGIPEHDEPGIAESTGAFDVDFSL